MEKLKKIIALIFMFIGFFLICIGIVNVKADTINVGYQNEFDVNQTIEQYQSYLNDARQYLITNGYITESDILITGSMLIGLDNPFTICKVTQNITITSGASSVWCDNGGWAFEYDLQNNSISYYGRNYYFTGVTLTTPEYIGYQYWYGGNENTTLTITNNSGNDFVLNTEYPNNIFGNNETINLYEFVNNLKGNVSVYPTLEQPIIEQFNGYTRVTFQANNYTRDTIEDYNVMIENLTNATRYYMQPTIDGTTQASYVLDLYENTTISYYVLDLENEDILEDYFLSITVDYDINQNFKILINSIDNNIKKINYTYQANENNTIENYTCFHQVIGGQEIQDNNCTYSGNNYNLILNGNENVTFKIYDNENKLIYQHTENFIFNLGELYITFNENYINNFANLEVRIHNYQNGYIVKYTIDNSTQYSATLQDYPSYDNSKIFNINNLNKNTIIKIYVYDNNNNIIATSQYEINIYRNQDAWNTNYDINNIFKSLNIKNIASELINYVTTIGNQLISTKLGNLILLEFFGGAIIFILKLIRR